MVIIRYISLALSIFALGVSSYSLYLGMTRLRKLRQMCWDLRDENIQLRLKLAEYEVEHEKMD